MKSFTLVSCMIESILLHVRSTCALKVCHKLGVCHSGSLCFGVIVAARGMTRAHVKICTFQYAFFLQLAYVSGFMSYLHVVKIAKLSGCKTGGKRIFFV